uniref:Outcast ele5 n=1 Tax=Rhipicephalus appendiculatus TaxID=34631 RepID=A0A131YYA9_RHIAP
MAYLDITGAYDNVNQEILWDILKGMDIGDDCVQLLREIYRDNTVCIEWEGIGSEENVDISKGLREGRPLSPLICMLYMMRVEKALEGSNIGFNMSHRQGGVMIQQKIRGLFYADDIVLFADNEEYIQRLADICGREGEALGLGFSVTKCGLTVTNDPNDPAVSIQGQEIPRVSEYKYLRVWINEGDRYVEVQEKVSAAKGKRNAAIMKHRALWGHNRHDVLRGLWKGIMVPGLTFGNSVGCIRSKVQPGMDVNQNTVGRLALGAHGKTTNGAVKDDMGWTSLEAREAQSKIMFEERLRNMKESRWPEKVFRYFYRKSVNVQWRERTRRFTSKYTAGSVSGMA